MKASPSRDLARRKVVMDRSRSLLALSAVALAILACTTEVQAPTPADIEGRVATSVSGTQTADAAQAPAPPATRTLPPPATPSASEGPTLAPPTETPLPSATSTPTTTATPVTGDPRTALGEPAWRDTFKNPNAWSLGDDPYLDASIQDGKLVLTGKTTLDGWRVTSTEVQDAYLEATTESGDCTGTDHYGLIFRVPDRHSPNEGYLLGFTCDGRYWLRSWDGENMTTLVNLTAAAAIHAGSHATNRIGVMADGDHFKLYANGTLLQEIDDSTWPDKGGFGLFIGARKTENFTTKTSEIAYWDLP
jgi:hypothetical protein